MIEDLLDGFRFPAGAPTMTAAVCRSLSGGKAAPQLAPQTLRRRAGAKDDGALSVYDDVDDLDTSSGSTRSPEVCRNLAWGRRNGAPLKGNDVSTIIESNGYSIQISGPSGRERYVLRDKGRIVGRGDLRQVKGKG